MCLPVLPQSIAWRGLPIGKAITSAAGGGTGHLVHDVRRFRAIKTARLFERLERSLGFLLLPVQLFALPLNARGDLALRDRAAIG